MIKEAQVKTIPRTANNTFKVGFTWDEETLPVLEQMYQSGTINLYLRMFLVAMGRNREGLIDYLLGNNIEENADDYISFNRAYSHYMDSGFEGTFEQYYEQVYTSKVTQPALGISFDDAMLLVEDSLRVVEAEELVPDISLQDYEQAKNSLEEKKIIKEKLARLDELEEKLASLDESLPDTSETENFETSNGVSRELLEKMFSNLETRLVEKLSGNVVVSKEIPTLVEEPVSVDIAPTPAVVEIPEPVFDESDWSVDEPTSPQPNVELDTTTQPENEVDTGSAVSVFAKMGVNLADLGFAVSVSTNETVTKSAEGESEPDNTVSEPAPDTVEVETETKAENENPLANLGFNLSDLGF